MNFCVCGSTRVGDSKDYVYLFSFSMKKKTNLVVSNFFFSFTTSIYLLKMLINSNNTSNEWRTYHFLGRSYGHMISVDGKILQLRNNSIVALNIGFSCNNVIHLRELDSIPWFQSKLKYQTILYSLFGHTYNLV